MRDAQRGEPRALDVLLARLRPGFVTFFARRLGSDAAEDAAQAALIRIAGAFRRIDPERAGPYIITVAENLLRSECRRHTRETRRSAPIELAETVEAPGYFVVELGFRMQHQQPVVLAQVLVVERSQDLDSTLAQLLLREGVQLARALPAGVRNLKRFREDGRCDAHQGQEKQSSNS